MGGNPKFQNPNSKPTKTRGSESKRASRKACEGRVDVAVAGAGAAGIAAAVSAARHGIKTLLLDRRRAAGGTGGFSGLTTLCGCYDDRGKMLLEGFAREFVESVTETDPRQMGKVWVLPYRPERFREMAERFLNAEEKISRGFEEVVAKVDVVDGIITSIKGIKVAAVIDC